MTFSALVKMKLNENLIKISVEKLLKSAFFDDYPYSVWAYNQVGGYNSALTKILLSLLFILVNRFLSSVQFSSVTQSCLTLCNPIDCSMPGLPVHHQLPEFTQTHVHRAVMPSKHLILCHPLLLPPSIFPSFRVFSNESVLPIRWPEY